MERGSSLSFVDDVEDGDRGANNLNFTTGLETAIIGQQTYLFAAAFEDHAVNVFSVDSSTGMLTLEDSVADNDGRGANNLTGTQDVATAIIGQQTYLFVAASDDGAVSVFSVAANGMLSFVDNVTNNNLLFARNIETATIGQQTYLFVAAESNLNGNGGVSVFSVAANGVLSFVDGVADNDGRGANNLDGANDVATARIGGQTFLFVTGVVSNDDNDGAVTVFSVAANGMLTFADDVVSGEPGVDNLAAAIAIETATIGGQTYLFVARGDTAGGVSVFSVASNGMLSTVDSIRNGQRGANNLLVTYDVETATIGGQTYLFVPALASIDNDNGIGSGAVSVFSVASTGVLTLVGSVRDGQGGANNLAGANSVATALIGDQTYLFVGAWGEFFYDGAVSVLRFNR